MTSALSCSKSVIRGLHVIYLCFMIFVGPIKEDCCVFPYIYQDVEYHNCIDKDHTTFWCATEVDSDGKFKEWKDCDEACDEGKLLFSLPETREMGSKWQVERTHFLYPFR